MKKTLIYSLILVLAFGCRKEDNPKLPDLERVPTPLVTKDTAADQVIDASNADAFAANVIVDLYFKNDIKPAKMDLVVIKNGDKSSVKPVQNDITTYPTSVPITGSELISMFGSDIVLGDYFDFGVNITTSDGQFFEAFPLVGAAYGPSIPSQPGLTVTVRYSAVCQFDATQYQGNFKVLIDEWADYSPGDIIPVTMINDHQISFEYLAFDARPIIIDVNTVTNETSVAKQVYGNYGTPPAWPYGDISVESVPSNDNFVAPCDGIVSVVLEHTVAAGSFGTYRIELQKVD